MNDKAIPQELKKLRNLVCWKAIPDERSHSGIKKIPINPRTGGQAMSNNPDTWADFDSALSASKDYTGLGFMFGGSGYFGVDIDEVAVRTANENAAVNHVEDKFTAIAGDLVDKVDGKYDIVVDDPIYAEPYGMGIHDLNGQTNTPMSFKFPDLSLAAEIGIDLDEWMQASPKEPDPKDKKNKKKPQPGQRLPFGREHVHYRLALFAEYGVLNTNATAVAKPVEFAPNDVLVQKSNTMLAMNGNTKLNNLFVGAKFTIQFEIPGKTARPVPPPPAYAMYSIVDAVTQEPLKVATVETHVSSSGKVAMREKQIGPKGFRQKHALGSFTTTAQAEGYYPATYNFSVEKPGTTEYVKIEMQPRPVLRVRVYNKETGMVVPATVKLFKPEATEPAYSLATDSVSGSASKMLEEGPQYQIFIAQMGYDTINMPLASIGDSLNIALTPIKKGEIFIVKNLHFATNKTRILSRSEEALQDLYMYLARNPKVRIKIIGHTDNVGKDAANQKLSDGRANEVMKDLIERGIAPERIEAEGRGESQPIDTNDTEEGRQNNRRVEIEIL